MIIRTFHPVGQGAFYSERHNDFNIVYDCGTAWNNRGKKAIDKTIKQSFSEDEEIDILFISHFDYDHVSKIKVLKDHVKSIKKVVMPLLHEEDKILLSNIYRVLNFNIFTLINKPQEFFDSNTQIITVKSTNNNQKPIESNSNNIDELSDKESIESSTILKKTFTIDSEAYEWIFIPYNYEYKKRKDELEKLLKAKGFDVDKLKKDTNYTLDEITNDVGISIKKGGKLFKQIYEEVSGNINQNSMLLYSGLNCKNTNCKSIFPPYLRLSVLYHFIHHKVTTERQRVSCIYTGDTDLNIVKIKSIFKDYWSSVGTIQIPHHGALKSFNKDTLEDKGYLCPMSVGEKNSYGHPSSKVLGDILGQACYPMVITENLASTYVETIEYVPIIDKDETT